LAPGRSDKLPVENMWTSAEFEEFLRFVCVAYLSVVQYILLHAFGENLIFLTVTECTSLTGLKLIVYITFCGENTH